MAMVLNKEIERIKSNLLNLSEDEFFEILKECGFGRILPTEKIFEQLDVGKIIHAKWIGRVNMLSGDVYYYCSNCGEPNPYEHTSRKWSKFCPKCGSEMILE